MTTRLEPLPRGASFVDMRRLTVATLTPQKGCFGGRKGGEGGGEGPLPGGEGGGWSPNEKGVRGGEGRVRVG